MIVFIFVALMLVSTGVIMYTAGPGDPADKTPRGPDPTVKAIASAVEGAGALLYALFLLGLFGAFGMVCYAVLLWAWRTV